MVVHVLYAAMTVPVFISAACSQISVSEVDVTSGRLMNTFTALRHVPQQYTDALSGFRQATEAARHVFEQPEVRLQDIVCSDVTYKLVKYSDTAQSCMYRRQNWIMNAWISLFDLADP